MIFWRVQCSVNNAVIGNGRVVFHDWHEWLSGRDRDDIINNKIDALVLQVINYDIFFVSVVI